MAKEIKKDNRPDLFAATPPLEAVKLALSEAATDATEDTVVSVVDVRRAYFYAAARRKVYVELPPEDWEEGDEEKCGLLRVSLYGTRDAAVNWQDALSRHLMEIGFERWSGHPSVFVHRAKSIRTLVHGDDYASA